MSGKLFLILGPSGVGKSTVIEMLKERHTDFFYPVSVTTREKRPHERDGNIYFFVSDEQFDQYIDQDDLLEWATIHTLYRSGTRKKEIVDALSEQKTVIREVNIDGGKSILESDIREKVVTIFILPPSLEHIKQRIINRSPLSDEELQARLEDVKMEMEYGETCDYRVVSEENQQEKVYAEIEKIILDEMT